MKTMSLEKIGGHTVEIEGVRHLGDHESVVYVRHIDGNIDDIAKGCGKSRKPVRRSSSEKRVLFSNKETTAESITSELSQCEVRDNSNNNNQCTESQSKMSKGEGGKAESRHSARKTQKKDAQLAKAEKVKEHKKSKDTSKSLELYGLSPRIARRHQQIATLGKDSEPGHTVHAKYPVSHVLPRAVDSLGLSPGIKRKGGTSSSWSAHTHQYTPVKAVMPHKDISSQSMDAISYSSNSSSSEPSPMQSPNLRDLRKMSIPPVPLHSGLIGTDEELEKLRFIKKALTPNPLLPDILRKISNSTSYHLKPPVAAGGRRRSVSMDPEDSQYKMAREALKKRVDSAHK